MIYLYLDTLNGIENCVILSCNTRILKLGLMSSNFREKVYYFEFSFYMLAVLDFLYFIINCDFKELNSIWLR